MATFNKDHKEEMGDGKYFEQGIHKVKIGLVEATEITDKEAFKITVLGENDEEGEAVLWFHTDKSIKYSFNTLRNIFVHNAPKDKKETVRKQIDALKNTKELIDACSMLIGKEAWYSVFENKNRPFTGNDGSTKYSYDRNVYGYEPKPPKQTEAEPAVQEGEITDDGKIVAF